VCSVEQYSSNYYQQKQSHLVGRPQRFSYHFQAFFSPQANMMLFILNFLLTLTPLFLTLTIINHGFTSSCPVRLSFDIFLLVNWSYNPPLNTTFEVIISLRSEMFWTLSGMGRTAPNLSLNLRKQPDSANFNKWRVVVWTQHGSNPARSIKRTGPNWIDF
jgi:hypothetical protein